MKGPPEMPRGRRRSPVLNIRDLLVSGREMGYPPALDFYAARDPSVNSQFT
jgi:hypothetical protein